MNLRGTPFVVFFTALFGRAVKKVIFRAGRGVIFVLRTSEIPLRGVKYLPAANINVAFRGAKSKFIELFPGK